MGPDERHEGTKVEDRKRYAGQIGCPRGRK